jgi:hypothetical protein
VTETWRPRVLREYAFIADGERGAVIGPDGAIVWLCVPRWDSPAVFATLIGGRGGYPVTPADPWHVWGGGACWPSRAVPGSGSRSTRAGPSATARSVT